MAQLQHNMWVANARTAVLSIISGGGRWLATTVPADSLYQHLLITAERKFWRCVETGERPRLVTCDLPEPSLDPTRIVDMGACDSWATLAKTYHDSAAGYRAHMQARAGLRRRLPIDAKEASGHGVRVRRAANGTITFSRSQHHGGHD